MENATPEALVFNGPVRLTTVGTCFVIFTVVIGFAAINTGNNSLYIGLTFMLGALLLSGLASKGGLKHLRVEFRSIDEAWAGRVANGQLRIENDSRIWNVRDVVIVSPQLARPVYVPLVPRGESREIDVAFLFARRGRIELHRLELFTRYPFGFFLKKRHAPIRGEAIVFPRLLGSDDTSDRFRPIEGELSSANRIGPGTDLHSFRDYVRGDSLRHVHWKKSAAQGRWIIKQTEQESGRAVHVVVDPFKPRAVSDEAFEEMISEAATFIRDALGRGLEVSLTLPRVNARTKEGEGGGPLFHALALVEATHEPAAQTFDRDAVVFTVRRGDDAKSA